MCLLKDRSLTIVSICLKVHVITIGMTRGSCFLGCQCIAGTFVRLPFLFCPKQQPGGCSLCCGNNISYVTSYTTC
eukprot:Gb_10098 [translate_table: standard]